MHAESRIAATIGWSTDSNVDFVAAMRHAWWSNKQLSYCSLFRLRFGFVCGDKTDRIIIPHLCCRLRSQGWNTLRIIEGDAKNYDRTWNGKKSVDLLSIHLLTYSSEIIKCSTGNKMLCAMSPIYDSSAPSRAPSTGNRIKIKENFYTLAVDPDAKEPIMDPIWAICSVTLSNKPPIISSLPPWG